MHEDKEISERAYLIGWLLRYFCCIHMETVVSFMVSSQNEAIMSVHEGVLRKAHDGKKMLEM